MYVQYIILTFRNVCLTEGISNNILVFPKQLAYMYCKTMRFVYIQCHINYRVFLHAFRHLIPWINKLIGCKITFLHIYKLCKKLTELLKLCCDHTTNMCIKRKCSLALSVIRWRLTISKFLGIYLFLQRLNMTTKLYSQHW